MQKKNKLSETLTKRIVKSIGKQKNNIAIVKHYGTFDVTSEDAKIIMMNNPEINTYYHQFSNDEMVQSFEPFLNIIGNMYSKYYFTLTIDEFLDEFEIYQLQKSFFKSYLESGLCERNEPFILDEIDFEKNKMIESVANIIIKLSKTHPIFVIIDNLHMAAHTTIKFLEYLYGRDDNDYIGIYAAYNELKPILPCNINRWTDYTQKLNEDGIIYEGGAYQVSEDAESNTFVFDSKHIFDYITKFRAMYYALDFEQADYYLENIYDKIELEHMNVDYEQKLEIYELYAQVSIYRSDIPTAQRICDKIKEICEQHPSDRVWYRYYTLVTYSHIYSGKLEKAKKIWEKCKAAAVRTKDKRCIFEADMLDMVLEMSGWHNVFFFVDDISVSEELIENAKFYKYYNHLAYVYIYAYGNTVENFKNIKAPEDVDQALVKYVEGEELAKSIGNTFLVIKGYKKNIMLTSAHGMFNIAKHYYIKCQKLMSNDSNSSAAENNNGLGYILCTGHDYEKANESYNGALDIYMKLNMVDYIGETLYNMAINCMLANDMPRAHTYLLICVRIIKALRLNDLRVCNIAKIYGLLAVCSARLSLEYNCILYLDTSKRFLSHHLNDERYVKTKGVDKSFTGNDDELFLYFYAQGLLEMKNGRYKQALDHMIRAERHCYQSAGNQFFSLIQLKMSMGYVYEQLGNFEKRDKQYKEAYDFAKEKNYPEDIVAIENVIQNGGIFKPVKHSLPLLKHKIEDINAKIDYASAIRKFAEVEEQLEYVSIWQNNLDIGGKTRKELIDSAANAFMLNYSLDSFIFIKFNENDTQIQYNNGYTKLSDNDLKFLKEYFEKNRVGFVVSKLNKNYNDYNKILALFGMDHICSMVCNPFFVNERLDSLFISCIYIKDNWNIRNSNYLLEQSEFNIFNLLLRQLLNAVDRIENIEKIHNINNELKKSAVTDYLTGLKNRDGFYGKLKKLIDATDACNESISVAILYIDLDNFKYYNDTYGHDVGDLVLKEVANVLSEIAGNEGFATRYGGDEFLITMVNCTKQRAMATAQLTLDNILAKQGYSMQISNFLGRHIVVPRAKSITCSIGVAYNQAVRSHNDLTELIKHADEALYEIKHSTKNGIKFF